MSDEDTSATITFSDDTKSGDEVDYAVESPIPKLEEGVLAGGGRSSLVRRSSRLSAVSKKYDIDGDGVLDETEQAMRDLDRSGRGYLSNEIVYKLLKEQVAMQRELLNKKRLIIFLGVFTAILALSNLGTAWAAAMLAKDTTTTDSVLVVKSSGEAVATNMHAESYQLQPVTSRRRTQETEYDVMTISKSDAENIYSKCSAKGSGTENVRLTRAMFEGTDHETEISLNLCPEATAGKIGGLQYDFLFQDGKSLLIDCTDSQVTMAGVTYCTVTGSALLLRMGQVCQEDAECETGYCFDVDKGAYTLPGWPGRCTCNPVSGTNAGCTGNKQCYDPVVIADTMGMADASPGCYMDFGQQCNARWDCLTGSCASGACACSELTDYGCQTGQTCVDTSTDWSGKNICQ